MSDQWDLKILCMGAGYVGGPTMAVIAKMCPKVRNWKAKSCVVLKDSLHVRVETGINTIVCRRMISLSFFLYTCKKDHVNLFVYIRK